MTHGLALRLARELGNLEAEVYKLAHAADTFRYLGAEERMQARSLLAELVAISRGQVVPSKSASAMSFWVGWTSEGNREMAIAAYPQALVDASHLKQRQVIGLNRLMCSECV